MSASEEIQLQLLKDGEKPEAQDHPEGHKALQLNPDDAAKGVVNHLITGRWKKVSLTVLTLLSYTSMYAAMSGVTTFYAIVAQNFNVATYTAGVVVGVTNLCLALLAPVIGYFLPHLGFKFTQVAGLFLAGGCSVLFGFVSKMPTPTLFIVFSLLLKAVEAIGVTMFITASYTLLTGLYLDRKGTLVSLVELAITGGYLIGVPIGGGLLEVGGFVLPFLVFGGISLFLTLPLLVNVYPTECTSTKLPWRIVFKMLKSVLFVLIGVCPVISLGTMYALMTYFGQFLYTQFGLRVGIIGAIYLSGLGLNTLASVSVGPIVDKLNIPRYSLIGGLVVGFAGCVLLGHATFITTPKLWLSILAYAVFETAIPFAVVPVYSSMYRTVKLLHVDEAVLSSTLSGILVSSYSTGNFLGPVIGGVLVQLVGFPSMANICALIILIYVLLLVIATVIQRVLEKKMNTKTDHITPIPET